jgi:hypothetical protein
LASIETTLAFEPQVYISFGVKVVRAQRQPILRRCAGEIVFRQVRPVDRGAASLLSMHNAAGKFLPPQHLGRSESRRAAADDHDSAGRLGRPLAARRRLRALLPDEDALPSCSTCQTASGLSAGRACASPVRKSKQA